MCAKFPELHVNDDEKQRELSTRIQQQFVHQYGDRWGGKKRAGVDDSLKSKDSMAYRESSGCSTWDMFQGNAAATILVHDGAPPDFPDMPPSDATFMAVEGRDWLGVPTIPDVPAADNDEKLDKILENQDESQKQASRNTAQIIARDDYNTQRVLDKIDDIKTQMEETLKKVLAAYLVNNRPDQPPPTVTKRR